MKIKMTFSCEIEVQKDWYNEGATEEEILGIEVNMAKAAPVEFLSQFSSTEVEVVGVRSS